MTHITRHIDTAIQAAIDGGREIMKIYSSDFAVEMKDDKSPLTQADKNAHLAIERLLEGTQIPILSEEGRDIAYSERSAWPLFWMVDPLDGTKEFVKRNGEFTVNIALIKAGVPILGIIYVPVREELYVGAQGHAAYKIGEVTVDSEVTWEWIEENMDALPRTELGGRPYMVVGSRSHMSSETEEFIENLKKQHGAVDVVSMGSSLKLCLVAEGVADVYPRFAPTMEWDTAAGHGIALGAGCQVIDHSTGKPMRYNKENLLNNWFVVQREE